MTNLVRKVPVAIITDEELEDSEDCEAVTEIYTPPAESPYATFRDASAGVVGNAVKSSLRAWRGRFKYLLMSCMDISASPVSHPSKKPSPYMAFHDPSAGVWGQSLRSVMRKVFLEERPESPQSFIDPSAGIVSRKIRKTIRKFLED